MTEYEVYYDKDNIKFREFFSTESEVKQRLHELMKVVGVDGIGVRASK